MYGKTDNRREGRREKESDIHDRMGKGMERERARKRVEIINNSGSLDTTGWQACMGELVNFEVLRVSTEGRGLQHQPLGVQIGAEFTGKRGWSATHHTLPHGVGGARSCCVLRCRGGAALFLEEGGGIHGHRMCGSSP